jgi:hypothetical protein
LPIIKLPVEDGTADTYERMEAGGPLSGGPDSVKINVGIWISVPEFNRNDIMLRFNTAKVLPIK